MDSWTADLLPQPWALTGFGGALQCSWALLTNTFTKACFWLLVSIFTICWILKVSCLLGEKQCGASIAVHQQ